jgi:hypothetical protein
VANARLLRPPHIGRFPRSFALHSPRYARETIAEIGSIWVALATAIIGHTGSIGNDRGDDAKLRHRLRKQASIIAVNRGWGHAAKPAPAQ